MSVIPCACPVCKRVFRISSKAIGKQATCPGCGNRLIVRQMGGRTLLELASVSPRIPTELYQDPGERVTQVEQPEPAAPEPEPSPRPRMRPLAWLVIGGLVGVTCAGLLLGALLVQRFLPHPTVAAPQNSGDRRPVAEKPLTVDNSQILATWAKARRRYRDEPFGVVAWKANGGGWVMQSLENQWRRDWRQSLPRNVSGPDTLGSGGMSREDAEQAALEAAPKARFAAVALVDLATQEMPRLLRWYHDDGNGVRVSDSAPNAAWQKRGERFLKELVEMGALAD